MNQQEWNSEPEKALDKALDEALARLAFERPEDISADYPTHGKQLRPLLETAASLKALHPVDMPRAESLAAGREAFLVQLDQLPAGPVSPPLLVRLKEWITTSLSQISESLLVSKEAKPMSTMLLRLAIVIAVLLGAAGGTAVVSAESLPDSALYPVKLALEDTRLALTSDPVAEAELNLLLAETRLEEIEEMSLAGRTPDEAVFTRLEKHFDDALRLAAEMPEEAMAGFLVRTQDRIQIQENNLTQTQARINGPGEESLGQANGILTRLRLRVESGLQEPQLFRHQHGQMHQGTSQETGPCNNGNCDPPHSGPPGNANQYGPGSAAESSYGPGPGDGICDNPDGCEPAGDANHYGQGSASDTSYGPGPDDGDGVCDNSDGCEPTGDANHYGQHNNNNNQNDHHSNQNNGQGGGQ